MISRPILFVLVFAWSAGAFAAQTRLTGIRYNIRGSNSRVTLLCTDAILYSASRTSDGVMLMLRNTEVGSPPGEAHLEFKSGNVRKVEIKKVGRDSAAVRIVMRNAGRVEYSSSEMSHQLYVDVSGGRQDGLSTVSSKTETTRGRQHASPLHEVGGSEDLRKLENPVGLAQMRSPVRQAASGRKESSSAAMILAAIMAVIIGGIGTLTILWLYVRKGPILKPEVRNMKEKEGEVLQAEFSLPTVSPAIPLVAKSAKEEDQRTEDDASLTLAERFQRSRGEIDFALHLSSGVYGHERGRKLAGTNPVGLTGAQRATVAKRLGVGQGEIELMAKFSRLKQHGMEEGHD